MYKKRITTNPTKYIQIEEVPSQNTTYVDENSIIDKQEHKEIQINKVFKYFLYLPYVIK